MYSSHMSTDFLPRVNASGKLFIKGRDDDIYDEEIDYGVDAKKGKAWAIPADPKFLADTQRCEVVTRAPAARSTSSTPPW